MLGLFWETAADAAKAPAALRDMHCPIGRDPNARRFSLKKKKKLEKINPHYTNMPDTDIVTVEMGSFTLKLKFQQNKYFNYYGFTEKNGFKVPKNYE